MLEILQKTNDLELEWAFCVRGITSYTPQQILRLKTNKKVVVHYDGEMANEIIIRGFIPRKIDRRAIFKRLLCMGNSSRLYLDIFYNISYDSIMETFNWQRVLHKGSPIPRLMCIQAMEYDDGRIPIYRHPAESIPTTEPFCSLTREIANRLYLITGYKFNHLLAQYYRNGADYIREHTDKTLDIATGTPIVNVSFGGMRRMFLKSKLTKEKEWFGLPHGSVFSLSYEDNAHFLHGINRDMSFEEPRISLTFRVIDTFITKDGDLVGKGAPTLLNNNKNDQEQMLKAFSEQNHSASFDEDKWYGNGFYTIALS